MYGSTSPAPRSPGASRWSYGSHSGESSAPSPGTRLVSQTVAFVPRGTRAKVIAQRHPGYAVAVQAKWWVARRSASITAPMCSPTVPGSAMLSAASRAWSVAANRTASALIAIGSGAGLELVRDPAQHLGDLGRRCLVRVLAAVKRGGHAVEELDHVLHDDRHRLGRGAVLGSDRGNDRWSRVKHTQGQRLRAAPALNHAELDSRAALEGRDAGGQGIRVQEHVGAVVVAEEAEALLGVVPLDFA